MAGADVLSEVVEIVTKRAEVFSKPVEAGRTLAEASWSPTEASWMPAEPSAAPDKLSGKVTSLGVAAAQRRDAGPPSARTQAAGAGSASCSPALPLGLPAPHPPDSPSAGRTACTADSWLRTPPARCPARTRAPRCRRTSPRSQSHRRRRRHRHRLARRNKSSHIRQTCTNSEAADRQRESGRIGCRSGCLVREAVWVGQAAGNVHARLDLRGFLIEARRAP
jgi:hypothetical protein